MEKIKAEINSLLSWSWSHDRILDIDDNALFWLCRVRHSEKRIDEMAGCSLLGESKLGFVRSPSDLCRPHLQRLGDRFLDTCRPMDCVAISPPPTACQLLMTDIPRFLG